MKFNIEQKSLLRKLGLDEDSDESDIEEKVGDYLQRNGFDAEYNPTGDGRVCESILDMLS